MSRFTPTSELVAADEAYIRANFVPGVSSAGYAGPAYVLDDGWEMFPADHFSLVVDRDDFLRRHGGPDAEEDYDAWLTGVYGVCLKSATPENIALKGRLMDAIEAALAAPAVDSATGAPRYAPTSTRWTRSSGRSRRSTRCGWEGRRRGSG